MGPGVTQVAQRLPTEPLVGTGHQHLLGGCCSQQRGWGRGKLHKTARLLLCSAPAPQGSPVPSAGRAVGLSVCLSPFAGVPGIVTIAAAVPEWGWVTPAETWAELRGWCPATGCTVLPGTPLPPHAQRGGSGHGRGALCSGEGGPWAASAVRVGAPWVPTAPRMSPLPVMSAVNMASVQPPRGLESLWGGGSGGGKRGRTG